MQNITQTLLPGLQPIGTGTVLLTVNGSAVGALSPQEAALYQSLFKTSLGPKAIQTSTTIPGAVAATFLKRSGLNKKQLHDIWSLSDSENQGYLLPNGFFKACRLVAHAQSSNAAITTDLLAIEPQVLPYFESPEGGPEVIWKLSEVEIGRYADLYRREGGTSKLDGNDARALLSKSGLTSSELCDIWDLGDVDKDGKLTFGEFLIVMQLVSKVRDGKAFLPSELPQVLLGYLKTPVPEPPVAPTGLADRVALAAPVETPTIGLSPRSEPLISNEAPPIGLSPRSTKFKDSETRSVPKLVETKSFVGIDRSRQFRRQMLDSRARLEALRAEARAAELAMVDQQHQVNRLQDQILHVKAEVGDAEAELDQFRRESGQVSLGTSGDVLVAVAAIRESIGEDEREVAELRAQLGRLQRDKTDLQSVHSVLVEKKRQADQDRNLIIMGLESDRSKLVSVRAERLKLWEQRHQLTREITTKVFDSKTDLKREAAPSRDRRGVRADLQTVPDTKESVPWTQIGATRQDTSEPWSQFDSGPLGRSSGNSPQFGTR